MVVNRNAALTLTTPSEREIVMTRSFDAPRRLVFDAWTKPEHLVNWFGPRGWTLPGCEIDLRPGGKYRFDMRGPNGENMGMGGVYREIVPPARLSSTEAFDEWLDHESVNTMILEERDGRTTMTITVLYGSVEDRDAAMQSGMEAGLTDSLDRLAELLETIT